MVSVPNSKRLQVDRSKKTFILSDKPETLRRVDPVWTKTSNKLFNEVVKAQRHRNYCVELVEEAEQKYIASTDPMKKLKMKHDLDFRYESLKQAEKDLTEKVNRLNEHQKSFGMWSKR